MDEWIHSVLMPKIGVIAAHDVSSILQSLGAPSLSFLFNPISKCQIQIPNELSVLTTIPNFQVKFVEAHRLEEQLSEVGLDLLMASVQSTEEPSMHTAPSPSILTMTSDVQQAAEVQHVSAFPLPYPSPWYSQFEKWFLRLDSASEFEAIHHPVALLYVASSKSPDIFATFTQLSSLGSNLPSMAKGWMDPNIPKFYLLLHMEDDNASLNVDARGLLATLKKKFGNYCYLLSPPPVATIQEWAPSTLWQPLLVDQQFLSKFFPEQIGNLSQFGPEFFVAEETVHAIHNLIQQWIEILVPYMQQCAAHWNETVAAPRRGFTGRFFTASKKYFGRPVSFSASSSTNVAGLSSSNMSINSSSLTAFYPHDAHESVLRRLGDYYFFLRQHSKAAQIYQTAARSFSYDKAWKHHAAALEMTAVCLLLSSAGSLPKDLDSLHEQILQSSATKARNATRATLLLTHLLSKNQPASAIQILNRMVLREIDFYGALFLEQIALLYASMSKRRLAMKYLVLAGNKFGKVGLRTNAIRCFSVASAHFPSFGWDTMRDHVLASLARHHFQLNSYDLALQYMLKLVRPYQTQSLEELIYLHRHHPSPPSFYELSLPTVRLQFTNDLCVNETAIWKLRIENPMYIPLFLTSTSLGLSIPYLNCKIFQEKIFLPAMSCITLPVEVLASTEGSLQVLYVSSLLNTYLPVHISFQTPIQVDIRPPQPRLESHWQDFPTSAYIYQISMVTLTLTNIGHVPTGKMTFTYEGAHVHMDNEEWPNLDPQASLVRTLTIQWLQSNVSFQWSFHSCSLFPPYRICFHLSLTSLFERTSLTLLSTNDGCVTLTTPSNVSVQGTIFGTSLHPIQLPPRTSWTHVINAPSTESSPLPFSFLHSPTWYFHVTSPAFIFHPLLPSSEVCVQCSLIHGHEGHLFQPMDVSLRIHNSTFHRVQVSVHIISNTSLCVTGCMDLDPWIEPHQEESLDWLCYPLIQGVHDLSQCIQLHLKTKEGVGFLLRGPESSFLYVR